MITTNWSITQLFLNKKQVDIYIDNRKLTTVLMPSAREVATNSDIMLFYSLIDSRTFNLLKKAMNTEDTLLIIQNLLTNPIYTNAIEFSKVHLALITIFVKYIEGFTTSNRILYINETPLTTEILDIIISIFKKSAGVKEEGILKFANERAKKLYEKQLAAEAKIAKMRSKDNQDSEGLMKICLLIIYAFPIWTVDALLDLTMAQLIFLQQYAAKACAYETESTAYANGNLKKPPKFFLE